MIQMISVGDRLDEPISGGFGERRPEGRITRAILRPKRTEKDTK